MNLVVLLELEQILYSDLINAVGSLNFYRIIHTQMVYLWNNRLGGV